MNASHLLIVRSLNDDFDACPDLIYFDTRDELVKFHSLIFNQFDGDVQACSVYHIYRSGDEYLADYGLLEDADDENTVTCTVCGKEMLDEDSLTTSEGENVCVDHYEEETE